MKQIIEKLISLEREISSQRGALALFCVFEREESPSLWDLVIAAPWVHRDHRKALDYVVKKIKKHLTVDEILKISRVVLLKPSDAIVRTLNGAIQIEHGHTQLANCVFDGLHVKDAHIITSKGS